MGEFWTRKYVPKTTAGIKGQEVGLKELKYFAGSFPRKRACLLHGPPGCGKTAAVYALASELGLELMELNASDLRNSAAIEAIVGAASKQKSLFFKGKLLLVDEIDGLAGREDRGGLSTLVKLIKGSAFPLILTANNPFGSKFSSLRRSCQMIQFNKLEYPIVAEVLLRICKDESINYEDEAI